MNTGFSACQACPFVLPEFWVNAASTAVVVVMVVVALLVLPYRREQ